MRSESEEKCKSSFDEYLSVLPEVNPVIWKDGDNKKPPDYYATINEKKYAVEVTMLMECVQAGAKLISTKNVRTSFETLMRGIQDEAEQAGILTGTYYVILRGSIPDFTKNRDSIRGDLLSYVRDTQDKDSVAKRIIFSNRNERLQIWKEGKSPSAIYYSGTRGGSEGEIQNKAHMLMQSAIKRRSKNSRTSLIRKF